MQRPIFPRIERAIHFTTEYFKIGRIVDSISKLDGGLNLSYLDTFYEVTISSHEHMQAEIMQTILGSNKFIQMEMFERLKECLSWWPFNDYQYEIELIVKEYNRKEWDKYVEEVISDEEKFKTGIDYTVQHNGEIKKEYPAVTTIFGHKPKRLETLTNKWFYCNTKKPAVINEDFIPEYFDMLDQIVASFKSACVKDVARYFNGQITPGVDVIIEKHIISAQSEPKLLEEINPKQIEDKRPKNTRIKVNISVEELTMLFRLLKEEKIIISKPKKDFEIHDFIAEHFETVGREDFKISSKNVGKLWSSTDPDVLTFWTKKFTDLLKRAEDK